MVSEYFEFTDSEYSKLRKSLIRSSAKGTDLQRDFLMKVKVTADFLEYIKDTIPLQGDVDIMPLADKMSESEFKDPPWDTENRLFTAWSELSPRVACRTTFWARVTYRHIENGRIESSYLAANGGSMPGGAERIDAALNATDSKAPGMLDNCVRAVFRRLGGLPEARGNRSVYVNCPLARGWWRERLVKEVAAGDSEHATVVREVVRVSQQYWEELVTFVVSRNSVFGSPEIRNQFIRTVGEELSTDPKSPLRNSKELRRACRTLSAIQASRELSVLPQMEVESIMLDIVTFHTSDARNRIRTEDDSE